MSKNERIQILIGVTPDVAQALDELIEKSGQRVTRPEFIRRMVMDRLGMPADDGWTRINRSRNQERMQSALAKLVVSGYELAPLEQRLLDLRGDGLSWRKIAEQLNAEGFVTPSQGAMWTGGVVAHHLKRLLHQSDRADTTLLALASSVDTLAPADRRIVELRVAGRPWREIGKALSEEGFPPPTLKGWAPGSVHWRYKTLAKQLSPQMAEV